MSKMLLSSLTHIRATTFNATLGFHSLALRHSDIPIVAIGLKFGDGLVHAGRAVGVVPQEEQAVISISRSSSTHSALSTLSRSSSFVGERKLSISLVPASPPANIAQLDEYISDCKQAPTATHTLWSTA
jgi:hypothetical protein